MAPGKRKRNERPSIDSGDGRPSPHRPGNTALGQHDREPESRNGMGGRRTTRGGRGGGRGFRNERRNSSDNSNRAAAATQFTPGPMSPPAPRPPNTTNTAPQPIATPNSTPVEDAQPSESRKEPIPYDYTHLSDSRVALWSVSGRQEVVAEGVQALDDLDFLDLSSIFQELIRGALDGKIDATDAGTCVSEILASANDEPENADGPALFLDSLSVIADIESFDPASQKQSQASGTTPALSGPMVDGLQKLVPATGISAVLMRQMLDAPLLQTLGLTRNTFMRAGIRQVTNILYRQANHNLLREETEGYSKLVTELYTTSGSEQPTREVVEDTFERVKGLIGTFDLDVGRVLDVTLDVFAAVLVKQFRFFVKFLRVSSWWPRESDLSASVPSPIDIGGLPKWAFPGSTTYFTTPEEEALYTENRKERDRVFWNRARDVGLDAFFELGGRHAVDETTKKALLTSKSGSKTRTDGDIEWIEATGTMPPSGNRVAAQLLGFKLRFYTSDAREIDDVLPENVIFLAALLIKIGFISLRDLYPHMWPLDEKMPALREAKLKEMAEKERANRPGMTNNALMNAGALPDDTIPVSRTRDLGQAKSDVTASAPSGIEPKDKDALPEPGDQKVLLLIHLLTIGAIPESLFMLGRFPWLPEAFPAIYDLLHRILHHSINKVFEASLPSGIPTEDIPWKKIADSDQASAPKGHVRRTEGAPRKALRWPHADKSDTADGLHYRFYWDEWADNVPVCQTVEDIFTLCSTLLNCSGVNIGRDATLLSKLATIGAKSLSQDSSEANLARWQDLLKRTLVPALSLTKSNTSVVNEIYDMLRYYTAPVRYSIYAEWFEGATSRQPAMATAFSRARLETLSTMKRISQTNLPEMARALAKTAFGNPGIVFKVVLDQIEAYSNLTDVVVDCARFFTDLGYDVLIWALMTSLGVKNRSRTREDSALLTSRWLIALSNFSAKIFKRYSIMNPAPILQYVNEQLYQGNATDLIILEELIAHMSGIVSNTDFTDSQLLAMTGGEILRRCTLINLHDKRFTSMKTAKRFMRSLTDTKLAGQLLISIAQHRQSAIYTVPEDDAHIKYLATMIDDTQKILVQYLDLLRSNLSVDQFDALIPSTPELMADFGLHPPVAFLLGRESYARRMAVLQAPSVKDIAKDQSGAGVATQPDSERIPSQSTQPDDIVVSAMNDEQLIPDSKEDIEMIEQPDGPITEILPAPAVTDSWKESLTPLIEAVEAVLPDKTWRLLSSEFYVVFWQLSLVDISMPMESYTIENARLIREISNLMTDRSDTTRLGIAKRDEERKQHEVTRDELLKESKRQMIKWDRVRGRLNKEKMSWFANIHGDYDGMSDAILEECFLPRLLLSPTDADYCFKFLKFLHTHGAPNFRTLGLYGHLFRTNRLRSMIFTCTIREAENLGRFLKHVLGDLSRWHKKRETYEREALGPNRDLPGFAKAMGKDGKPATLLEHEDFRRIVYTFHKNLNTAIKACLAGTEWMHIRNAITVLKAVIEYFPALDFMGKSYQTTLLAIAKREMKSREDLSLTANAVMPELKKREWKWVMPQAFATNLGESGQQNGVKSKVSAPIQQEAETTSAKSALKPTAPDFKPQPRATSNGASTPKHLASNEVEDGEVRDARATQAARNADNHAATTDAIPSTISEAPNSNNPENEAPLTSMDPSDREGTAQVQSNNAPHSLPPLRPDFRKNSSTNPVFDKTHPGLPNRPDVPFPSHMASERNLPPRQADRRDGHHGRQDRPGDGIRDRAREPPNFERRVPDSLGRDLGHPSERVLATERDRDRHDIKRRGMDPLRDGRDIRDLRDHRDRGPMDSMRNPEMNGRLSRNEDMLPPRQPMIDSPQGSTLNPNPLINPGRAAQIYTTGEPPRPEPVRLGRDDHRERPISRPHSPRRDRYMGDRDHQETRRGPPLRPPPYMQEFPRGRHEDQQHNLSGQRIDRTGDRILSDRPRDASAFQPSSPHMRPSDPDHGRLNQTFRSQADPNFGRLNPASQSQIPSGPSRDRNARSSVGGNRTASGPQPRFESRPSQQDIVRPPTPDVQPPTGPAASRAPRRSGTGSFDAISTSVPVSNTAALPSPTGGVHPDRLRHIDPATTQQNAPNSTAQPARQPSPSLPSGIHPSRLQAFEADQTPQRQAPPALQTTSINAPNSRPASPPNLGTPSGPKGLQVVTNNSMSPNGLAPPTGPSSASERTRQLAGINSTLQQAGQRSGPERHTERVTNIRGRSSRNNLSGPGLEGSSPYATTPAAALPPNRDNFAGGIGDRRDLISSDRSLDLFPSRLPGLPDQDRERDRVESHTRPPPRGREPPLPGLHPQRHEGGRPGRHSRRSSRSRSPGRDGREVGRDPERDRDRERTRDRGNNSSEDLGRSEYRDRGRPRDGRERRQGERDMGRRDGTDKGRDVIPRLPIDPEWSDGPGTGGDLRGGGVTGGGNGNRRDMRSSGDSRRDSRGDGGMGGGPSGGPNGGGSGRKRRGDDGNGAGVDNRGHDKRPRR